MWACVMEMVKGYLLDPLTEGFLSGRTLLTKSRPMTTTTVSSSEAV